ncbi:MAG: BCCT family transporter [Saprospiraceae bacterium]
MLGDLPFSQIVRFLFLIIVFLSFVTASDSNTSAMSGLSSTGISPDSPEPSLFIKIIWGATIGAVALIMMTNSGIDGVKMVANLGGFPAFFLYYLLLELWLNWGVLQVLWSDYSLFIH